MLHRRQLLSSGLLGLSLAALPNMAWAAAATDKRFVFIIQRGAADGLEILAPTGDPDFLRARGDLAADAVTGAKLNSLFTLHPQMAEAAKLYGANQAQFYHAIASGYRERSHFDAQNILESGARSPYGRDDGWLNRLLGLLPQNGAKAMAIGETLPLVIRGNAMVSSYAPSNLPQANADLMARVSMLYAQDAKLTQLWSGAMEARNMAGSGAVQGRQKGAATGKMVAGLMAGANGARVVTLETNGWDTHSQQKRRLGAELRELDALIAALRDGLGAEWANTMVLVATEFGRTVAFNGTQGSDHGTASAAMLFGGGLANGGQITSDWPGLAPAKLYEGRDLRPTLRFEDMVTTALSGHYAIDPTKMKRTLFPDFI
jgi:uncharacterized protein (DUF1501 family)